MYKQILIIFFKTFNLLIKSLVAAIAVYLVGSIFFDYQVIDIIDKYFIIIFLVAAIISSILDVEIEDMENILMQKVKKWHRYGKY
ncbi:hypothetical protein BHU61_09405 [Macrococcus epidermidis]|uniref:Uncharacterized protein n=1 Tax=Macrococcus epidermidis TaxID=1902580 RepID=A0A327ZPT8_9STAP|nr:hypothetical protein [Macrococcus epidermidis]RAK44360.1 hypothetical protein BHU61_09405 [Macrococcus epidermidis]